MPRSDRNKVRFNVEQAINDLERAEEHLARLDIIADGRSTFIDEQLPRLVLLLDGVKQVLVKFRSQL